MSFLPSSSHFVTLCTRNHSLGAFSFINWKKWSSMNWLASCEEKNWPLSVLPSIASVTGHNLFNSVWNVQILPFHMESTDQTFFTGQWLQADMAQLGWIITGHVRGVLELTTLRPCRIWDYLASLCVILLSSRISFYSANKGFSCLPLFFKIYQAKPTTYNFCFASSTPNPGSHF